MSENKPTSGRLVWVNGEIRDAASTALPIWSNVAHYGTGVFEGIRCYPTDRGAAVFRLLEHTRRLVRSAQYYGLTLRWTAEELAEAVKALLRAEGVDSAYVRPLVYFGEGPPQLAAKRGCPTEAMIMTRPLGKFLGEENFRRGVRLTVSTWRKIPASCVPTTAKASGQYTNSVIAAHQAVDRGFDDALLLTYEGNVAEGTGANIFFVKDGVVTTNDASSSILLGVTRDSVLTLCKDHGVPVSIRAFTLPELLEADEAFLTGTAAEVTPIREIDGQTFSVGPDSRTHALQQRYREAVEGRSVRHAEWLSLV
jgi:branched-chain amino acid aminotransferase